MPGVGCDTIIDQRVVKLIYICILPICISTYCILITNIYIYIQLYKYQYLHNLYSYIYIHLAYNFFLYCKVTTLGLYWFLGNICIIIFQNVNMNACEHYYMHVFEKNELNLYHYRKTYFIQCRQNYICDIVTQMVLN